MMKRSWVVLLLMVITPAACDDSGTGPEVLAPEFGESPFANCRDDSGIRICIAKSSYEPGETLPFTIANALDRTVFEDRCSGGVDGLQPSGAWGGSYGVGRHCAPFTTRADILAHMRYLPRGRVLHDTLHVNSQAFEGEWRVWIRVLDANAEPLRAEPFTSPVFQVTY